jgi:hypothetical protein
MLDLLKIVFKWKFRIITFTVIAVLVSVVITMPAIMPPYYKSKMVFYLSNPVSTDRAALFNEQEFGGVSIFGGKEEINRFLSILNSAQVSEELINKYDLGRHYKMDDSDSSLYLYYTQKEFDGNFNAIRNDLGAIVVSILDTDARLAAAMTKEVVRLSDSIYRGMLTDNKSTVLSLIDKQIAEKKATGTGENSAELLNLTAIRDQYAVSNSDSFKTIYVVEEAAPAVKKTKPVRWIIVLSVALASFFMASLVALVIELYKHADKYGFQHS